MAALIAMIGLLVALTIPANAAWIQYDKNANQPIMKCGKIIRCPGGTEWKVLIKGWEIDCGGVDHIPSHMIGVTDDFTINICGMSESTVFHQCPHMYEPEDVNEMCDGSNV